jgi:hypothetical protein
VAGFVAAFGSLRGLAILVEKHFGRARLQGA